MEWTKGRVGEEARTEGIVPTMMGGLRTGTVDRGEVASKGDAAFVPVLTPGGEAREVKYAGSTEIVAAGSG